MDIKAIQTLSFEDGYDRLEELIQKLEKECSSLSLEEQVALYEEGIELARHCGHKLDATEHRVSSLLQEAEQEERGLTPAFGAL